MMEPRELVGDVLEEYGALTEAALDGAIDGCLPSGVMRELITDYPARGGRRLRPTLCLAVARALGGTLEDALGPAVTIELLHNGFLIHDDIEDQSTLRRGRPALHMLHGVPIALNAGDALYHLALRHLLDCCEQRPAATARAMVVETERMCHRTVEGQATELHWRHRNVLDLSERDYLQVIFDKTCWYTTIYPCRSGALAATGRRLDDDAFVRFGFFLGAAFQIQDDARNLERAGAGYGKDLQGDLREGKRTLQLIHLYRRADAPVRRQLHEVLGLPIEDRGAAEIAWILEQMRLHGSLEYAVRYSHGLAGAALHEFAEAFGHLPDSRDKRFVEALCGYVVDAH